MAVEQVNNANQVDTAARYNAPQKKQEQIAERKTALREKRSPERDEADDASGGVRVTLSRKAERAARTERKGEEEKNPPAAERQRAEEVRNAEAQRAVEAYKNAKRIADETARPETARPGQIRRITG